MHVSSFGNGLRKDLAALAAGVLFPFSLAPFEYATLAFVSLAVLFMAWDGAGLFRAALRGFLFGLGQFSIGLYWVYVTLHDYAGTTDLAALLITASFVCFLAGFPALVGLIGVFVRPATPAIRLILVYPALWIFLEWLRAWMEFPGCPWLQVGYSQLQSIPGAIAPVMGQYGVGLFAVMTVGTVVYIARSGCPHRKAALAGLSVVWCLTALFQGYQWTEPVGQAVKVSLLQGNIPQELKWLPSTTRQTLRWYIDHTVDHWDSDLIVWPETAVPVHYHNLKALFDELGQEATEEKTAILIGVPIYDQEAQKKFNGVVAIGLGQGRYLKGTCSRSASIFRSRGWRDTSPSSWILLIPISALDPCSSHPFTWLACRSVYRFATKTSLARKSFPRYLMPCSWSTSPTMVGLVTVLRWTRICKWLV